MDAARIVPRSPARWCPCRMPSTAAIRREAASAGNTAATREAAEPGAGPHGRASRGSRRGSPQDCRSAGRFSTGRLGIGGGQVPGRVGRRVLHGRPRGSRHRTRQVGAPPPRPLRPRRSWQRPSARSSPAPPAGAGPPGAGRRPNGRTAARRRAVSELPAGTPREASQASAKPGMSSEGRGASETMAGGRASRPSRVANAGKSASTMEASRTPASCDRRSSSMRAASSTRIAVPGTTSKGSSPRRMRMAGCPRRRRSAAAACRSQVLPVPAGPSRARNAGPAASPATSSIMRRSYASHQPGCWTGESPTPLVADASAARLRLGAAVQVVR